MGKFMLFSEKVQNVFETEDRYKNFGKLMVDHAMGKSQVEKEEADKKIRQIFSNILGVGAEPTRKELRKAIRRNQVQLFEVIEETVEELLVSGWQENEFFNNYVETKNLAIGDENEFYVEDDSVLTVSEVSGNHHALIRQRLGSGSTYKVKTSWYGVKIYEEFEAFLSGASDWAKFITKIYEAIDNKMNEILYDAVMSAGDKFPTARAAYNKTGALDSSTKEAFFELLENVSIGTGKDVVVMGTKAALQKLNAFADVQWASEELKRERYTLGHLGTLEGGYKLVEIPQRFQKGSVSNKLIDNTKLLIMPQVDNKFVKVVNEGDIQIKEVSDSATNMDMTYEYEVLFKMGVSVITNVLFGVWTIA